MGELPKFYGFCWWLHTSCRLAARPYAIDRFWNSADLSSIVTTQFIGAPLYWINRDLYYAYMALTKQSFGVFVTTLTQWWAPTVVRVSGDASVAGQIKRTEDGRVELHFPGRLVLIANHQVWKEILFSRAVLI
jgi:1-acyl-sn-glycerol-3-phosphate acyltransferase